MAGYVIIDVKITDPERYQEYRTLAAATLEAYGGRYLARGGKAETLEGDWDTGRIVVLEFDSIERARAWWASEEYSAPKAVRQSASVTRMILVEGV
ncbi:MAG: DUF1330 domain-containing protein [Acidobacteria bacterium]|nr:DUF1330 domain-containing protein [Acidobacteriota bacterium]